MHMYPKFVYILVYSFGTVRPGPSLPSPPPKKARTQFSENLYKIDQFPWLP